MVQGDIRRCKHKTNNTYRYFEDNEKCFIDVNEYHDTDNMYDRLPEDDRYLKSGIDDIDGGDTFFEYTEYFFDTYGKDLFDD